MRLHSNTAEFRLAAHGPHEINLVPWVSKLALELTGQAGLGYLFSTFEGRNDEFLSAIKQWVFIPRTLGRRPHLTRFLGQSVTI
ncbi:hypothetical protein EDB92DRAFT_1895019 [Lactarius akahatsu]|uniref:Uncharacterized protein n=1 Tax=Lactarius akahatsu TaxID=416441 RepID=A0AAD4L6H4_9AGAM|nr:hypothetical protein EDB92DRAFT_1895019 [Lactarius akahatsu]